jgi:radical SAM-linked protein
MEELKIRFKFKKVAEFKYLSHLETIRLILMAIARAKIKVKYSQGFNPKPKINLSFPVPVGLPSLAEYADIDICEEINSKDFKLLLNKQLNDKMSIIDAKIINNIVPSLMADIEFCSYNFKIKKLNKNLSLKYENKEYNFNNIKEIINNKIIDDINKSDFINSIYKIDFVFDENNNDIVYLNIFGYTKLSKNNKIFKFNDFLKYIKFLSNNNNLVVEDYFKKEAYVLRENILKTPLEIV